MLESFGPGTERLPVMRGYRTHVAILWRASRGWALMAALCSGGTAVVTAGTIWSIGRLVGQLDRVGSSSHHDVTSDRAWAWFFVLAGLLLVGQGISALGEVAQARVSARYHEYVLDLVAETVMRPQGVGWLETSESASRMRQLVEDVRSWLFRTGVDGTWRVLGVRLTGFGAILIAVRWRWWATLVVALSFILVGRAYALWISKVYVPPDSEILLSEQRSSYFRAAVTGGQAAKEVRLFGLTEFFVERFRTAALMTDRLMAQSWRGASRPVLATSALVIAALGGALVLLAHDAMNGGIAVGSSIAVLQALLALSSFGPVDDAQTGLSHVASTVRRLDLMRAALALPRFSSILPSDPARPAVSRSQNVRREEPRRPAQVVFDNVSFTYASRNEPTLRALSLRIEPGESVAVVGVNGAGKSTLIKLLAGLYKPTVGRVLIDGQDASQAREAHRVAVVFQDFVRYPLSLRDNVAYGSLPLLADERRLESALEQAGATSLLKRLEHGWDTVLSREFYGGTDLSGGQWQRVALARALAAIEGGAGVLVLDEPTAALDIRAEAALFNRFLAVTQGITTLLVSHRLSSVRHADRIVVLDADVGAIVEDGSHEALMAAGGQYAAMFHLQASRFSFGGAVADVDDTLLDAAADEQAGGSAGDTK